VLTGAEIQRLITQGQQPCITASRLYGTAYGVGVQLGPDEFAGPIVVPGSNEALKFDSLDEVAAFLLQIGVTSFQITI
jgi:hypothetical protein